jgi:hypothetical protein
MANNETCNHGAVAPVSLLSTLHDSQAGSGRHKCPVCAYEQGFFLSSSRRFTSYEEYLQTVADREECQISISASSSILRNLGPSQAGSGRHKCTNCAFRDGFLAGLPDINLPAISIELVATPTQNMLTSNNRSRRPSLNIDFEYQEQQNKQLGLLGELFILESERNKLTSFDREDLALQIDHVSQTIGDGLGYDILSFDENGNEMKIEVKTTRGPISRPFYLTINELNVSIDENTSYHLYRIFDFDTQQRRGKYYILSGQLTDQLNLQALLYKAIPNA